MYVVEKVQVPGNGLAVYDGTTKLLEVLELGATLNFLSLTGKSLIYGYSDLSTSSLASCRSGILLPFPNRLDKGKYSFEGKDYQFPINEPANDNAIHGFVFTKPFELSSKINNDSVTIICSYDYQGTYDHYPFPFRVEASYRLQKDQLQVTHKIMNSGLSDMPVGYGWHPYFTYPSGLNNVELTMDACEEILLTERQLPTGEFRTCTDFKEGSSLSEVHLDAGYRMPEKSWEVKLNTDLDRLIVKGINSKYIQLFTPAENDSIAIEPMSCGIDVFNSGEGLLILRKGESTTFETSINYTKK
jgi:aldose 1-epimerase